MTGPLRRRLAPCVAAWIFCSVAAAGADEQLPIRCIPHSDSTPRVAEADLRVEGCRVLADGDGKVRAEFQATNISPRTITGLIILVLYRDGADEPVSSGSRAIDHEALDVGESRMIVVPSFPNARKARVARIKALFVDGAGEAGLTIRIAGE